MKNIVQVDVAVFGGGIAGLWLLNRLKQSGYSAILLEMGELGGGQTHVAQGIIHGGMKYALQGALTAAAQSIADMPLLWRHCLQGHGPIDLTQVPILSEYQYLWSTGKLASKLTGFFANAALQSRVKALSPLEYPVVFQHPKFKGLIYALAEMAVDMQSVVRELAKPYYDAMYCIDALGAEHLHYDAQKRLTSITLQSASRTVELQASHYVFTAGIGNELPIQQLQCPDVASQRRPLHMVIAKVDFDYSVFAHCFGLGATPRITITTHKAEDGKWIWYLGGQIAEEGVQREPALQQKVARKELQELFPWLDFSAARFASFYVDRAEPAMPGGKRPDSFCVKEHENLLLAWPTKMAMAPLLAGEILMRLNKNACPKTVGAFAELSAWERPRVAKPIWDKLL